MVLSLLLGAHPPELPVRDLVPLVAGFGVTEPTLRVALTRMVAAGDLVREEATYRLSERLLERQRRQDEELTAPSPAWSGDWELALVSATGRTAEDRAALRGRLAALRLGELREGVWSRPANLARPRPRLPDVVWLIGRPDDDPATLPGLLWDLDAWQQTARGLMRELERHPDGAASLATAAAMVRHLRIDPLLPGALQPRAWPARDLREAYADYAARLRDLVAAATA